MTLYSYQTASETLEQSAQKALQQIEDQRYAEVFQQKNIKQIVKIGTGFAGDDCTPFMGHSQCGN